MPPILKKATTQPTPSSPPSSTSTTAPTIHKPKPVWVEGNVDVKVYRDDGSLSHLISRRGRILGPVAYFYEEEKKEYWLVHYLSKITIAKLKTEIDAVSMVEKLVNEFREHFEKPRSQTIKTLPAWVKPWLIKCHTDRTLYPQDGFIAEHNKQLEEKERLDKEVPPPSTEPPETDDYDLSALTKPKKSHKVEQGAFE